MLNSFKLSSVILWRAQLNIILEMMQDKQKEGKTEKVHIYIYKEGEAPSGWPVLPWSLIPENNALISPNLWKKIPQLLRTYFSFALQILKIN